MQKNESNFFFYLIKIDVITLIIQLTYIVSLGFSSFSFSKKTQDISVYVFTLVLLVPRRWKIFVTLQC